MFLRLFAWLCILNLVLSVTAVKAAQIALVDFADQWTQVDALRQTLDEIQS